MKPALLALLLTLPALAAPADLNLEQYVANDIQGLADDTVNEGETSAHVVYEGDKPVVSCRLSPSKKEPGAQWAFCKVDFEVSYADNEETVVRECNLLYSVKDGKISRGKEELFSSCLEWLGESLE